MNREQVIALAKEAGGRVMPAFDYGDEPDKLILHFDALEYYVSANWIQDIDRKFSTISDGDPASTAKEALSTSTGDMTSEVLK